MDQGIVDESSPVGGERSVLSLSLTFFFPFFPSSFSFSLLSLRLLFLASTFSSCTRVDPGGRCCFLRFFTWSWCGEERVGEEVAERRLSSVETLPVSSSSLSAEHDTEVKIKGRWSLFTH